MLENEYTSITAAYAARLLDCPSIAVIDVTTDRPIMMDYAIWPDGAVAMLQPGGKGSPDLLMQEDEMAEYDWSVMHTHIEDSAGKYTECFLVAKTKAGKRVLFADLFIYPMSFAAVDYMLTDLDYHIKHSNNQ